MVSFAWAQYIIILYTRAQAPWSEANMIRERLLQRWTHMAPPFPKSAIPRLDQDVHRSGSTDSCFVLLVFAWSSHGAHPLHFSGRPRCWTTIFRTPTAGRGLFIGNIKDSLAISRPSVLSKSSLLLTIIQGSSQYSIDTDILDTASIFYSVCTSTL